MTTLATFVIARRTELGLSQIELARRAGLNKSDVNAIEKGRVALPGAEKRRRLAHALRVRPVDLLVAAGELLPEEVPGSEPSIAESSPPYDPNDDRTRLMAMLPDLSDDVVDQLLWTVEWWERQVKQRVVVEEEEAAIAAGGFYPGETKDPRGW